MKTKETNPRSLLAALILGLQSVVARSQPVSPDGPPTWLEPLLNPAALIVLVLAVVIALAAIMLLKMRRPRIEVDRYFPEQEIEGSKYEQLLAEIQGLSLRVKNGEGKGDFRKIEKLARVFLERSGYVGARKMTDDQLKSLLATEQMPQSQASILSSIVERCKQGTQQNHEKLDFNALELLRELRDLVWANEKPISQKSA